MGVPLKTAQRRKCRKRLKRPPAFAGRCRQTIPFPKVLTIDNLSLTPMTSPER
ncbi:MAG: hypothetical protein JW836_16920 [Deltaproteobacteria bacterium]|nr:hypothetical protein [Deltaproteobacteria bacterium]